ncbi:hypothetical protein C8R48DRAFT_771978 [Suillus tomentosus]|nr:hypothetical protein C8R48DRAFT_781215 [Suillus tomentosus]KAG1867489.1 hypothetical protein C8R48DRAFT_771978 [Suillus tomentosus]
MPPPLHTSASQDADLDSDDIDFDSNSDDMDFDSDDMDFDYDYDSDDIADFNRMMRTVTYLDKLSRRSPGFFRFAVVMINVFNRVHVRMPTEGQQGIQFLDDIFAVFKALDDTTIETLISILTCMRTAIPSTRAPEGCRRFIQLDTSVSGPRWCVKDVAEDDDLLDDDIEGLGI